MQLYIEYGRITNQIFHSFSSTFKCFNHECQMPIAHSVFKQTVLNVSAQLLQQHTIEICCKMIQLPYHELVKKKIILYCRQNGLRITLASLGVSSIVFQHSTQHIIIHWHIRMVHFLLFLHQNCRLVTGSLRKLYF